MGCAGKYYLVDGKYANMPGFIAPYSGVPYSLLDFAGAFHPQDAKEIFNHRHSALRNVTDRAFGALKSRFPILMSAPPYPLPTQVKLVVAACAIHNYIRGENSDDWIFKMYEDEVGLVPLDDSMPPLEVEEQLVVAEKPFVDTAFDDEEIERSLQLRDAIAAEIWNDHIRDYPTS